MLFPLGLSAQEGPVSISFSPPEGWVSGDEVEVTINYGTESQPIEELLEVQFEIEMPEGTRINADQSELITDASGTWFGADGAWSGTAESSHDGAVLLVSLARTNERPASGYAEVARVKGLVMEIDEIFLKSTPKGEISVLKEQLKKDVGLVVTSTQVLVDNQHELAVGATLEVYDFFGNLIGRDLATNGVQFAQAGNRAVIVLLRENGELVQKKKVVVIE